MKRRIAFVMCCVVSGFAIAQEAGKAAGKGELARGEEKVAFFPRYSYAYAEGNGPKRSTWIVLTEKEPPLKAWRPRRTAPKLVVQDGKQLKGSLKTGAGSCPAPGGAATYCEQTGDYSFDAPLVK